ncbi:transmembrane channel-like protein 7 [Aphomia sociella]
MDDIEMDPMPCVANAGSTLRQTLTMRSNTARQVVSFMPSRQLPYNTLRRRRSKSERNALLEELAEVPESTEKHADIIVREMEQNQKLMKDNPVSQELRREALRDLPQGLTMKRNIRAKLSASVSLRSERRTISFWRRFKYRTSFAFKKFRDDLRNVASSIELWYEAIRQIEGHFGSAVGTYFHFLRALFLVNVLVLVLVVSFVVLPQSLHDRNSNVTDVDEVPLTGENPFINRDIRNDNDSVLEVQFLVFLQSLHDSNSSKERTPIEDSVSIMDLTPTDDSVSIMDFISGKGVLENSLLFYGHYHYGNLEAGGPLQYNMAFAYFFTMSSVYLMIFIVLCYRTADSYRRNFIETDGARSHMFAGKVFCGWDYGVVSERAARLHAASLCYEFKELLNEQNKKQVLMSPCVKLGRYLANTIVNVVVLAVIIGLQYGLWKLLEQDLVHLEFMVSLIVTAMMSFCPVLFDLIVRLEYYNPRTALYVTLVRTWLLDMSTLVLLFLYWTSSDKNCWETNFGQEMYRLVLLDAFISLFVLPAIEFIRALIYKLKPTTSPPEFNIAYNSLTLIYNQAVMWFGVMFSPLLVASVTVKLLLLFYVKRECAMRACQPARKVWRAAQTQTVLYMLVTLSLFTTLFTIGSLFFREQSQCGPFRELLPLQLASAALKLAWGRTAHSMLTFLTRPGVIGFLMLSLGVCVYYMRARALAQASMVGILRKMLLLQAKDKEFLLGAIEKVSNGEWQYSPKENEEGPDSYTWKYLCEVRKPSNSSFHFDASRLSHSFVDRPHSYVKENRPNSYYAEKSKSQDDGDTDSSFSWKGSNSYLNQKGDDESKKWT